jgi:DNA-binding CsgD family transcriptional regulator
MALTSNDETDLLLPLYRGFDETPRFATFLDRLRRRAGTQQAWLILDGDEIGDHGDLLRAAMRGALRPYRAYALAELAAGPDSDIDARIVMLPLPDSTRAWLVITRDRPCTAADSALLSSLAPYVQTVVATWRDRERERTALALSSDGIARAGAGWILFDAEAKILEIGRETARRLAEANGAAPISGERLRGVTLSVERKLVEAAASAEKAGDVVLAAEPRIEAVLRPVPAGSDIAQRFPRASLVAWCRFETDSSPDRASAFAGLHDLPRREAELAVALADGLSLSDAAQQMGLTIETARNYSKRLYAKLGVSGQAQLVRLVLNSGAVLA